MKSKYKCHSFGVSGLKVSMVLIIKLVITKKKLSLREAVTAFQKPFR
ncbi:MAG: hypothetical protein LWX56_00460 [Ignavibacteria bacterium]|nr:hypothetical protein [Ignavibacteria bacterium]